jgi:hypothetical protein
MAENQLVPPPLDGASTDLCEPVNSGRVRSFHRAPKSAVTRLAGARDQSALADRLKAARIEVDRACDLLVQASPESMERSALALEAASRKCRPAEWRELLPETAEQKAAALEQARQLRAAIRRASHLLETAATFRRNWTRMLCAMTGGYTGQGSPALISRASRVLVRA